ncbi:hypothetical protein K7432_010027 [Basidiobolus ranarum]|uniref:Uncharacterized protein n=1 Tax=Basidiobolus ranarum TaxID=34480 RepID=A0ABR2WPE0_9FUNG
MLTYPKSPFRRHTLNIVIFIVVLLWTLVVAATPEIDDNETPKFDSDSLEEEASAILQDLDQSYQPCDDFYKYSCGGWQKRYALTSGINTISVFGLVDAFNRLALLEILENEPKVLATSTEVDRQIYAKARRFYSACLDDKKIEEYGVKPLTPLLKLVVTEFPVSPADKKIDLEKLTVALARISQQGIWHLFGVDVEADSKSPLENAIYLMQPHLGLPSLEYYSEPQVLQVYQIAMMAILSQLSKDLKALGHDSDIFAGVNIAKMASDIIKFEKLLSKHMANKEQMSNPSVTYNPFNIESLSQLSPNINWKLFFETITTAPIHTNATISESTVLVVKFPKFLHDLSVDVLAKSSPQAVQGFLIWRIITRNISFLPDHYRKLFSLIQGKVSGSEGTESRTEMCVSLADEAMGPILGRYFVLEHFGGNSQQLANRMISDIKRTFKERLPNIEWLNSDGKRQASEKIDNLVQKIGYSLHSPDTMSPESLEKHYEHLEVDPHDYFGNAIRFRIWTFEKHFDRIGKPVNREEWKESPITVNAFYNHRRNEIEFPAGILQKPMYNANRPDYLNYGAIGTIVGHELTHGFDNKGSLFDKFGKQRQWWDNSTIKAFNKKTECLITQYSKLKVRVNGQSLPINPKLTLGENIADNAGVIEAYNAWKRSTTDPKKYRLNNPKLPGLENMTAEQLFFISFGRMWCSNIQDTASLHKLRIDTHSPDNHRVNGVLRNNKQFAEAFKCPLGSPMNPPKKCTIW